MELIKFAFIFSFICAINAKINVPVLLWAPNRLPAELAAISPLQLVSYQSFSNNFLNSFHSDKILLFLQDELSIEDFSSHSNQLTNLERWNKNTPSMYLPSVENPGFLYHDLPSHGYDVINIEPGFATGGIDIANNTKTLVVIKLPQTSTNPSRKNAMHKADEVIDSVMSKIGGRADFVAIFTAMNPSVNNKEFNGVLGGRVKREVIRVKRLAIQKNDPGRHFPKECALLYLTNNIYLTKTENKVTKTINVPRGPHEQVADCVGNGNGEGILKILFRDVGELNKLHITLKFNREGRRAWHITGAKVAEYSSSILEADLYPVEKMDPVPLKRSYVCGRDMVMRSNKSDAIQYRMVFRGLQVEAFTTGAQKFSPAWDCVGFFTIPIWSGLLVTALLLMILAFGMAMLFNLKGADRFDDPKGKHTMVAPASAE